MACRDVAIDGMQRCLPPRVCTHRCHVYIRLPGNGGSLPELVPEEPALRPAIAQVLKVPAAATGGRPAGPSGGPRWSARAEVGEARVRPRHPAGTLHGVPSRLQARLRTISITPFQPGTKEWCLNPALPRWQRAVKHCREALRAPQ